MRTLLQHIYYSFPVQLFILHFRKNQLLLIFWYVLVSSVNSDFMKGYGADALFFVPEYLGQVNALSAATMGIAMGVFFMSWNITTFILHTQRFKFLAATDKPFLKYCINNSLFPLFFLIFYLVKSIQFNLYRELLSAGDELALVLGFVGGLMVLIGFSFAFFFGADRTILRTIRPVLSSLAPLKAAIEMEQKTNDSSFGLRVGHYFNTHLKLRKVRAVQHYDQDFLDSIFKRHHFAAMVGIILAFIFLVVAGFFLDIQFFKPPAAVSILIFFALMVAVMGALSYFLQSWSLLFLLAMLLLLNFLYQHQFIDPRNQAYGLNYTNENQRPVYSLAALQQLCTPPIIAADKANMLDILHRWKAKQSSEKPVLILMNVSGGGLRSSTFVMNALQQMDSATGGKLLQQTFLISGASGGMLAAAYYRALYNEKRKGVPINLHAPMYTDNISKDLLNPVFSSLISRDIFSPAQKFSISPYQYIKDRGYAFEQQLNENVGGLFEKRLSDFEEEEKGAHIPLMIFNAVVTTDSRKMMMASQPISFMMKPASVANDSRFTPDAIDFSALFSRQNPGNLRLLSALRMNATFPYVLPNVWLPSRPVIDVMDAGLRDNFGQETALRFVENFKEWMARNTSGVLVLQLRDRQPDNWKDTLEAGAITDILVKPATLLQHNWFRLQDYFQSESYEALREDTALHLKRLTFIYGVKKEASGAVLNFHLTAAEKKDVIASFNNQYNQNVLKALQQLLK